MTRRILLGSLLFLMSLAACGQPAAPPQGAGSSPSPAPPTPPTPAPARAAAGPASLKFRDFGQIPVVRPAGVPAQVALLLSGDQGLGAPETQTAAALAAAGTLVFEIDVPHYFAVVNGTKAECLFPAADFEEMAQTLEKKADMPSYQPPVLVGTGSGATLAYAALAQSPPGTFAGAVSLGFCPMLTVVRQLCHGDGLRWEKKKGATAYRLLPDRKLDNPWIVIEAPATPACAGKQDIVHEIRNAEKIPLPTGAGPDAWKAQLPRALTVLAEKRKQTLAARAARAGDVADLPLAEMPATAPEVDALAIGISGSGGWEGFDVEIGKTFAARGVPVVGLSSVDYFWKEREPDGTARDLARILDHYLKAWHKSRAILVGYSQGADVLPFMVSRLPPALRARVAVVGMIGPDPVADFDMGFGALVDRPSPKAAIKVAPEVPRLRGTKVVCVFGKRERKPLCPRLDPAIVELLQVPSGHAFEGNAPLMINRLLAVAGVAKK